MYTSRSSKPVVSFGEILLDVLPDKSLPGGAPLNVAYHLAKLDVPVAVVSRIGPDLFGHQLMQLMEGNGIKTNYVQYDPVHETGWVKASLRPDQEMEYDIVADVAWDYIQWEEELAEVARTSAYFIYGTLSSRNVVSRKTLMQFLENAGSKVLDINLRPPYVEKRLTEDLLSRAQIVKVNAAELDLIAGWYGSYPTVPDKMKLIFDRFKLSTLIVTLGAKGAALIDHSGIYRQPGYKVTVADTIGSGDAFLAGFLYQQLSGRNVMESLDFASRLGAMVATLSGGSPPYNKSDIGYRFEQTPL